MRLASPLEATVALVRIAFKNVMLMREAGPPCIAGTRRCAYYHIIHSVISRAQQGECHA